MSIPETGYSPALTIRTCARCGQTFRAFEALARQYFCDRCKRGTVPSRAAAAPTFTPREQQVIRLVKQAKANKEIAFELGLTEGTVKVYLCSIFRKTGVKNRTELALYGRDQEMRTLASAS